MQECTIEKNFFLKLRTFIIKERSSDLDEKRVNRFKECRQKMVKEKGGNDFNKIKNLRSLLYHLIGEDPSVGFGL